MDPHFPLLSEIFLLSTLNLRRHANLSQLGVSTTNSAMEQWVLQLASARQTGPEITPLPILIVVGSWW
jgi:hypothetical protein